MSQRNSALSLRAPALSVVRIGLIGLGQRGLATLRRYAYVAGARIVALADLSVQQTVRAQQELQASGRPLARTYAGEEAWQRLCEAPDVDLIYICTDWESHARMACYAMTCDKHVAVEVPAATSVAECWRLVLTAEATQRHCFMTENCCYDWFSLATRSLHTEGFFGTITHCEGAYLHDWRTLFAHHPNEQEPSWYIQSGRHGGNPYPTHGIGPIAQLLGFHRGDRMQQLVSLTSQATGRESLLGHVNSALIQTERGVTILLQFDGSTPRPYSRLQSISGTRAFAQKYPQPLVQHETQLWTAQHAEAFLQSHSHSPAAAYWLEGQQRGVPNPMNYAMDCRLVRALQAGEALDIDVYDAAEWSCLAELSQRSAAEGGAAQRIPDFLHDEPPAC